MKKIFTLLLSAACFTAMSQTPFLPTSVVVYRVGDGLNPLRGVGTKVFLDEFSSTGTLIQSVEMPTNASGSNFALTSSGSATSEGMLSRSADSRYLLLAGYNSDTGIDVKAASAAVIQRTIARVDALATINISTLLGTTAFSANNVRTATSSDGTNYWAGGANSGIRYGTIGDSSVRVTSATTSANFRALSIFNGQLYASSTSGSTKGILSIGTGLPTDSSNGVLTLLPGIPTTGSPYQFYFADLDVTVPGVDVLYIADDGAATGIQKYSLVGGTWVSNGSLLPAVTGTRGLAAITSGTNVAMVTTTATKMYSLIDASGYNQPITGTFTEMATAATNTAFRGVALAPIAAVAPLKLVSFKAMLANDGANLNWTSANESNTKDFAIERSKDGKEYVAIGHVVAQNKNEAAYTFTDRVPFEGINYYRLKMNDVNDKFTYSPVVTVSNRRSVKTEVFPNPALNNVTVSHSKAGSGATIVITNVDGQQVKLINVQAGAVQTNIAVDKLVRGHYIVVFNNNGDKSIARFMKQ